MKDEDYLVHNINKIGLELKHINWNLGIISAHLTGNEKVLASIKKEVEAEKDGN